MADEFGKILKELRLREGFGLRRFASLIEMQPSNLSALEHGRRSAPLDPAKLKEIAEALGLVPETADWKRFFDASTTPGSLPADIAHLAERKVVPALLRTIDNRQLNDDDVSRLIEDLNAREGYAGQGVRGVY